MFWKCTFNNFTDRPYSSQARLLLVNSDSVSNYQLRFRLLSLSQMLLPAAQEVAEARRGDKVLPSIIIRGWTINWLTGIFSPLFPSWADERAAGGRAGGGWAKVSPWYGPVAHVPMARGPCALGPLRP